MEEFSNTPPAVAGGLVVVGTQRRALLRLRRGDRAAALGLLGRRDRQHRVAADRRRAGVHGGRRRQRSRPCGRRRRPGAAISGWPISLPGPRSGPGRDAIYRTRAVSSFAAAGGLVVLETRLDDAHRHRRRRASGPVSVARVGCGARSELRRGRLAAPARARRCSPSPNDVPTLRRLPDAGGVRDRRGTPLLAAASSLVGDGEHPRRGERGRRRRPDGGGTRAGVAGDGERAAHHGGRERHRRSAAVVA